MADRSRRTVLRRRACPSAARSLQGNCLARSARNRSGHAKARSSRHYFLFRCGLHLGACVASDLRVRAVESSLQAPDLSRLLVDEIKECSPFEAMLRAQPLLQISKHLDHRVSDDIARHSVTYR